MKRDVKKLSSQDKKDCTEVLFILITEVFFGGGIGWGDLGGWGAHLNYVP